RWPRREDLLLILFADREAFEDCGQVGPVGEPESAGHAMTLVERSYGALVGLALGRAPPPPSPAVPVCEPKSCPRMFVEPTTIAVAETIPAVSVVPITVTWSFTLRSLSFT